MYIQLLNSLLLALLFFSSCGTKSDAVSTPCTTCKIFVSATQTNGNFKPENSFSGELQADSICNSDKNRPSDSSYYYALLGSATRTTSLHWVLKASTKYIRADGSTTIGSTNSSGVFAFPLDNAIDATASAVWTGFGSSWEQGTICGVGWNSDYKLSLGGIGDPTATSTNAINSGTSTCQNTRSIYCVEY